MQAPPDETEEEGLKEFQKLDAQLVSEKNKHIVVVLSLNCHFCAFWLGGFVEAGCAAGA